MIYLNKKKTKKMNDAELKIKLESIENKISKIVDRYDSSASWCWAYYKKELGCWSIDDNTEDIMKINGFDLYQNQIELLVINLVNELKKMKTIHSFKK